MKEVLLSDQLCKRIESIYREMEECYEAVASDIDVGCEGCTDNYCVS